MEENKRVYPSGKAPGKWFNYILLFLSVVLLLSGLLWRGGGDGVELNVAGTPTPIPTDAAFDETVETREMTLPSRTWYALQLGAFENEQSAAELAKTFEARGAAGYVWKDTRYRALAALYPTQADIQQVRTQLSGKYGIDSYTYEVSLPTLTLRMTGMRGQLDILEAGFLHADDLVSQLQKLSILMDRQEVNAEEAIQQLGGLRSQMETVSLRLSQRFGSPRHGAVQGLIDLFDSFAVFTKGVQTGASAVELATDIKYQALDTLYRLKTIYDGLGNT